MILSEGLFQQPNENKIEKMYNPETLKQIARDKIRLDDKQRNKALAKKMINPYFFTDRNLKVGLKLT